LDKAYDAGQSFQVKVDYRGSPEARTDFFGSTFYFFNTHGSPARTIASSLSQPYQAHYWWPCKDNWGSLDEPMSDKFTIHMWITVPDWMVVAANGALQGTDALSGGRLGRAHV